MSETMQQLKQFFREQKDLKVFGMNGSRVNPNIPEDKFKDYDVVFFTTDLDKYIKDPSFLNTFGEILIMTEPENDPVCPNELLKGKGYVYLVQYVDGLRIDLQIRLLETLTDYLVEDSLTLIIEDKDNLIKNLPVPTESDYYLTKPSQLQVENSITEFWWMVPNILKATLRNQLLLAEFYLRLAREEVVQTMTWTIAAKEGWNKNYGKECTHSLNYLDKETRAQLSNSFVTGDSEKILVALREMIALEERYGDMLVVDFNLNPEKYKKYKEIPYIYLKSKGESILAETFKKEVS
ncbi:MULTISPECIES: aminoglycoside 6-adenylyltransferase [Vagococcus]|uniref:Aminoglycoside 6-adenylyltransferase n=1 Tax=Vagococcus fluvialis bH819 TaxID=1255619 RepID=A0A1X6WNE9_9ENTE|nr:MULTISPECIES: aminoglycoside 6-adenylyltransferase [Vagococcus]SLM85788.1 Aminoglycoside 6-adenylyltransferase [Vagococcus fluvialis bH819]HCM90210.1 hypothetical protein [Vagococcus sp.]